MKGQLFRIEYDFLKNKYLSYSEEMYSKGLKELDAIQLQNVIAKVIKNDVIEPYWKLSVDYYSNKKIAVYFSMEFLLGRIVIDALVNTGIKKMTSKIFADQGVDINILEEVEDTALGNGGLGRLAACFIEAATTTGYPVLDMVFITSMAYLSNNLTIANRQNFQMIGRLMEILGSNQTTIKPLL